MIKLIITIILITISIVLSQPGNYPPSGLYVGISSSFLTGEAEAFSKYVQNKITNASLPDQSGSGSGSDYSFSSFDLRLSLQEIFYNQLSTGVYQVGWYDVQFELTWNYHICADTSFNPCEDGEIAVYTNGTYVQLVSDLDILYNSTSTSISASSTQIIFEQGDINIQVQCTNTICLIPVDDIANSVAADFITSVTTAITNGINEQSSMIESLFTPIKQIPIPMENGDTFWIDLQGQLVEQSSPSSSSSSDYVPTLTSAFNGGIILLDSQTGNYIYPSRVPTFTPTNSQLESFQSDYQITITGYLLETLFDSGFAAMLPLAILPDQIPSDSPVHLNTSDSFFSSVAPALYAKYPNEPIQVSFHSPVTPTVNINSTDITLVNLELSADFIVSDGDNEPFTAFTALFTIFDSDITSTINQLNSNSFSLDSTLVSINPNATISSSSVGPVDPSGFVQLLQMVGPLIKIPSLVYTIPTKYSISSLNLLLDTQVIQITFDLN